MAPSMAKLMRIRARPIPRASMVPISWILSVTAISMVLVADNATTSRMITPRTVKMFPYNVTTCP